MSEKKARFAVRMPDTGELVPIPDVDETQMREVDRIAVEEFGLGILQMTGRRQQLFRAPGRV